MSAFLRILRKAAVPLTADFDSRRWRLSDVILIVNGNVEAIIADGVSAGAIENISIGSVSYALSAFPISVNLLPVSGAFDAVIYDSFFGGVAASAASSDGNGDALNYRIMEVRGDSASELWSISSDTGLISAHFSRPSGHGYSWIDVAVSDGIDISYATVAVSWAVSGEYEPPIEYAFTPGPSEQGGSDAMYHEDAFGHFL